MCPEGRGGELVSSGAVTYGGDWVVNPDGTMVTTYHLRDNARWHDGAPITAHDFAFAYEVYTDDSMPVGVRQPETLMSRVEAKDDDAGGALRGWHRQIEACLAADRDACKENAPRPVLNNVGVRCARERNYREAMLRRASRANACGPNQSLASSAAIRCCGSAG